MYIFLQLALIFTYSHHCGFVQPSLIYYFFFQQKVEMTVPCLIQPSPHSWISGIFQFRFCLPLRTAAVNILCNSSHSFILSGRRRVFIACVFHERRLPRYGPNRHRPQAFSVSSRRAERVIWSSGKSPAGVSSCVSLTSLRRLVDHFHFSLL